MKLDLIIFTRFTDQIRSRVATDLTSWRITKSLISPSATITPTAGPNSELALIVEIPIKRDLFEALRMLIFRAIANII